MLSNMQKRLSPKKDESLKNYAIWEVSCKPRGTISSARKHVFEKSVAKVLQKQLFKKCQVPKPALLLGFQTFSNYSHSLPTNQS